MCSFSDWNAEKTLARRSEHLLAALEPEKDNNKHFTYSFIKMWWKFEITLPKHLLWVSICFWSYSPVTRHCCTLLPEERAQSQTAQTAQRSHSLRGTSCLESFCRWCPRVSTWLRTGEHVSRTVSCTLQEYFPMPILIEFCKVPHSPFHWSRSAIQINPQNILV